MFAIHITSIARRPTYSDCCDIINMSKTSINKRRVTRVFALEIGRLA